MEIKAIFGILSVIFTFGGLIPYFIYIKKGKIYPHNLSWIGWALMTFIGGVAMLSDGWQWSVLIVFTNALVCLFVVLYSIYKKVGIWSTTKYDYIFFGLGILGVVFWQVFSLPIIAIIFAVLADFSFGIPTIIKVYKNPRSEMYLAWLASSAGGLLSLFAVKSFIILSNFLYPLYLFIFDTTTLLIILILKNKTIKIENKNKFKNYDYK